MKISDIKYDDRKSRVVISTDSDQTFVLNFEDYSLRKSLYEVGCEIDEDLLYVTEYLQERTLAREKAIASLSFSSKSTKGLIKLLIDNGFSPEVSKEVSLILKKEGFINDKDFCARCFDIYLVKGYGPIKINYELYKKGFTERMIEYTFSVKDPDFNTILVDLMREKVQGMPERTKLYDYFYSHGYSFDLINYAYHVIFG